ncbi:MAG: SusD/RagB family nutrient-binding outer membrane lipoprotein [Bacteroidota bacterium]
MKQYIKITSYVLILLLSFAACEDFEELNTNPDLSTKVTPDMLASTLILDITRTEVKVTKGFMLPYLLDKYILWTEFAQAHQYNKFGRTDFDSYVVLTNVNKMIEAAAESSSLDSYTALGHFVWAWKLFNKTMEVGDIPYHQALLAETEQNFKPEYDTQKEVFLGILDELDKADQLFAAGASFKGDPVYNGDPVKWRKVVNTFQINVLINLSNKTSDTELNVANRLNQILSSRPLMESNDDNFGLVYSDAQGQTYPFSAPNPFSIYPIVSSTLTDKLIETQDRRLFYYAAPSPVKIEGGASESDWDAYVGVDPSTVYSEVGTIAGTRDYSTINDRYYLPEGEPIGLVGYAQLKFNLAEAAVRGWISDDAETLYSEGIKAAMTFVADNTVDDALYHHNMKMDNAYIEDFPSTASVVLNGTTEEKLEQILNQKYIATYLQIPKSAFYDNRRTGYPVFPINPDSNQNEPSDRLPKRWMYPQSELDYNSENVKAAIERQYNSDDVNETMWILKN